MRKNAIKVPAITPKTTFENARRWLNIIRFGESGTVIQLQDDCEYRILEIINNRNLLKNILGPYYKKYLLKYLPIDQKDLHKSIKETLIELCVDKKISAPKKLSKLNNSELLGEISRKGFDVGLFVSHITPLLKQKRLQPFIDLELLIRLSKNLSVIVFSEMDITHKKYDYLTDKCSFLYDHIIKYQMYGEEDSRQFISHYSHQWNFSFSPKVTKEIIQACGGYLWLIHQAQRNLRDDPSIPLTQALNNDLLLKKLEVIWNKFTEDEKAIIRKTFLGNIVEKDILTHEYKYLNSIRVIKEIKGKSKLGIPLLSKIIERENKLRVFQVRNDRIFIKDEDISLKLARKERLFLSLLLAKKKKIISRDTLAQAIWGSLWEEKFSDWALDRLAYRVRKKLRTLGIEEKLLKTVKKKGFVFG